MFEHPIDTEEEIERCLNCPLPECRDCIRWGKDPEKMSRRPGNFTIAKLSVSKLVRMYNEGKSIYEMAEPLGIGVSALQKRLNNYKLPVAKANRPMLTREYLSSLGPVTRSRLNWED